MQTLHNPGAVSQELDAWVADWFDYKAIKGNASMIYELSKVCYCVHYFIMTGCD